MLLAESETLPVVGLVGGIIAVLTVIGGGIAWAWDRRKASRKDTIGEWAVLLQLEQESRRADVKRLTEDRARDLAQCKDERKEDQEQCRREIDELRQQNHELSKRLNKTELDNVKLEADNQARWKDIRALQDMVGTAAAGVVQPCRLIATFPDGIIQDISIEAGAMFHYNREELIGQSIEILMPRKVKPIHRRKMDLLIKDGREADPGRGVKSYYRTKEGREYPCIIFLSGPWGKADNQFMNADITRRGDSDRFPAAVRPPDSDEFPAVNAELQLEDTIKAPKET